MDHHVIDEIREVVAQELPDGDTRLTDLHVWRVGRNAYAAELALVTRDDALTPDRVRRHLAQHEEIVHVTVEINRHS